jgi:hypothetical protein
MVPSGAGFDISFGLTPPRLTSLRPDLEPIRIEVHLNLAITSSRRGRIKVRLEWRLMMMSHNDY